ncbi:hypothetical protein CROQUDRAFT_649661 [Cronartium quercuum f. sp. fusiforme G11]|uniref:F-box domain-containing protein n=1 Tax=Cronartium quercuum f. sp. fusiforme G11 TaxID=708437 RepID=A0A9P6NRX8_9BASI|nr:hypothetical protein CROQUDRAFT_649661 [Cronartium quercuum f. sp. fusiforme G11]
MPTLRKVPRIYHLRDTARATHDAQRASADATTPSEPIHPPLPQSLSVLPGPSRYRLRSSRTAGPSRVSPTPPHASSSSHRRVPQYPPSPILRMPAEILYRIGQFLEPPLDLDHWCAPGEDLLRYTSTCTTIRHATASLIGRHIGITIDNTPFRTFRHALERLNTLAADKLASRKIRKLFIKDDLPRQTGSPQSRMDWHRRLGAALMVELPNIEMFAYVRDLEQAVRDSPYDTTPLGIEVIQGLAHATKLETVFLGGVHMTCWSPERMFRPILPLSLGELQLFAVHDSILPLIKLVPNLKVLRIWRNFLVPAGDFGAWFEVGIWSKLEELQISGFYGNEVTLLQASLRDSRRVGSL